MTLLRWKKIFVLRFYWRVRVTWNYICILTHIRTFINTYVYMHTHIYSYVHPYVHVCIYKIRTQNHFSAILLIHQIFWISCPWNSWFPSRLINKLCIERSRTHARIHAHTHARTQPYTYDVWRWSAYYFCTSRSMWLRDFSSYGNFALSFCVD